MSRLTLQIPADHPTGAGHFPSNPIIPGALLLGEVVRRIERAEGMVFVSCSVKNAKFHAPVRPGDAVEIAYEMSAQGSFVFDCRVAGNKVLSGAFGANS